MPQSLLRFGIRDDTGRRAATWKLWSEKGKSDVYLACRVLGGKLKASLHESGAWHIAYTQRTFEEDVRGAIPGKYERFVENWYRPSEIAPGITLAFRIVTPWSAPTHPTNPDSDRITWLPNAPEPRATEIDILFTSPNVPIDGWPARNSMDTTLVGYFALQNLETIWAVRHVVDMPDLSAAAKGTAHFFKNRTRADLEGGGLRALAIGAEADGSKVFYDCAVRGLGTSSN